MEISYSYEVVSVGPNSMEVSFSTLGGSTVLVGTSLPPVGVTLSNHLIQFAPIIQWIEELTPRQVVEVGTAGNTTLTAPTDASPIDQLNLTPQPL